MSTPQTVLPTPVPAAPPRRPWQVIVAALFLFFWALDLLRVTFSMATIVALPLLKWGRADTLIAAVMCALALTASVGLLCWRPETQRLALIVLALIAVIYVAIGAEALATAWHAVSVHYFSAEAHRGLIINALQGAAQTLILTGIPFVLLLTRAARAAFIAAPREGSLPPPVKISER